MRNVVLGIALLSTVTAYSSNDSLKIVTLQREVMNLKSSIYLQKLENRKVRDLYLLQKKEMDTLKASQQQQKENVDLIAKKLDADLTDANQRIDANANDLSGSIKLRTAWGIIAACLLLVLLGVAVYLLRKRISKGSTSIDEMKSAQEKLQEAQVKLQEESIKLDDKLIEVLNKQLPSIAPPVQGNAPDHSLVLKVGDEIVRIETNLSRMDASVKGYKQLAKAVERIRTNFLANGYEIVEMLGKPYNDGMKVVANFVSDDTLAEGEQKITGIIKPQINYKGKMIQSAQITVSQNL